MKLSQSHAVTLQTRSSSICKCIYGVRVQRIFWLFFSKNVKIRYYDFTTYLFMSSNDISYNRNVNMHYFSTSTAFINSVRMKVGFVEFVLSLRFIYSDAIKITRPTTNVIHTYRDTRPPHHHQPSRKSISEFNDLKLKTWTDTKSRTVSLLAGDRLLSPTLSNRVSQSSVAAFEILIKQVKLWNYRL